MNTGADRVSGHGAADIAGAETHPFLRNRCYGETPAQVSNIARAVADAHLAAGVLPVAKHLPGHGRAVHVVQSGRTLRRTLRTTGRQGAG